MGALVPQPVNVTESAIEGWPGSPRVVPPGPCVLRRARSRSQCPSVSHFQEYVPCTPTGLSSEGITFSPPTRKGGHLQPGAASLSTRLQTAPVLSPWRGREWPHAGPESQSLSSTSLGPGPGEEARRLPQSLWAGPASWWPAGGSSGPSRSSRRCPSSAAAAGVAQSGNTGR